MSRPSRLAGFSYVGMHHVHLLVEAANDSADLRRFCKLAKQRSGAAQALTFGGPLWQEGYYERIVRNEDDVKGIARYILENPIRGGLASALGEYPHCGSDRWTIAELLDVYHD